MKKELLFVGWDSSFSVGFTRALRMAAYDLLPATEPGTMEKWVRQGRVHLVLFAPTGRQEDWHFVQDLAERYPLLPIVYILTNDHPLTNGLRLNAHRKWVKPLTPIQHFLETISHLQELGKTLQEGQSRKTTALPLRIGSTFDFESVISSTLGWYGHRFGAKNVYWVSYSLASQMHAVTIKQWGPSIDYHLGPHKRQWRTWVDGTVDPTSIWLRRLLMRALESGRTAQATSGDGGTNLAVVIPGPHSEPLGFLVLEGISSPPTGQRLKKMEIDLPFISGLIGLAWRHEEAWELSYHDELSGLYNQRYLRVVLERVIAETRDRKEKFSVLFMDVDRFKSINDTRGHLVGSKALSELGKMIYNMVDSTDYAFRYGGDEYMVICTNTDSPKAMQKAERIRSLVAGGPIWIDGHALALTVSIGLATYPDHADSAEEIIRLADEAMYHAKAHSRNVVYLAS